MPFHFQGEHLILGDDTSTKGMSDSRTPYASKQSSRYMQKVLEQWAFSPRISSRENNELERFVQFPPKGYAVLAYPLKAFEERAATE